MKKWTEQAPADTEWLEKTLPTVEAHLKKHIKTAIKISAPLIGLLIFFSYFFQNKFFPTFDIYQFSSLLLAAFAFASLLLITLSLLIFTPGWLIFHIFLNAKSIKEDILYALPYTAKERQSRLLEIFRLCVLWPLIASTSIQLSSLFYLPNGFNLLIIISPALILLATGILLQTSLNLKKFSFLTYFFAGYMATLANTLFWVTLTSISSEFLEAIPSESLQIIAFVAISLLASFLTSTAAIGNFIGWRHSLYISAAIAIFFSLYSGALSALPGKFVRGLSLGNYSADILISKAYCEEALLGDVISTDKGCLIKNAKIIWSLGDNLLFNLPHSNYSHVKLPSSAIQLSTLNIEKR